MLKDVEVVSERASLPRCNRGKSDHVDSTSCSEIS